jgi:ATP phosphoribosyltransferase regulatory subunit
LPASRRSAAVRSPKSPSAAELRTLAAEAKLGLDAALDLLESRTGFLAARGIDVGGIRFSTAFGRGLDYYTGCVFELHDGSSAPNGPLVAGGRYDELLTRLGAKSPIPAVGFAVWIERASASGGAT